MSEKFHLYIIDSDIYNWRPFIRTVLPLGIRAKTFKAVEFIPSDLHGDGIIVAHDDRAGNANIVSVMQLLSARRIFLPVIAFSENPAASQVVEALRAGALDYITAPIDSLNLIKKLKDLEGVADEFRSRRKRIFEARALMETLTNREFDVINGLSQGLTNKELADNLKISPRTVEIHRATMMRKINASHSIKAVSLFHDAKLQDPLLGEF